MSFDPVSFALGAASGGGGGGGGGGVLVCHVDLTTGALDKTYREIANADLAILKVSENGENLVLYLASYAGLPTAVQSGTRASGGWGGYLAFVNIYGPTSGSALPSFQFVASDPDGYPAME